MQIHGGDWASYEIEYGKEPLDFSASVSPLGLPECARDAAIKALSLTGRYPDPLCRELREKLSEKHGVSGDMILCGNGASDIIYRAFRVLKAKKAVMPVPTFKEYETALQLEGTKILPYRLDEANEFQIQEGFLTILDEDIDLLILCEPNNPTGVLTDSSLCHKILQKCREKHIFLLIDACFADFLTKDEYFPWEDHIANQSMLVVRAMTKFYAMAGLRLGYAICADTSLLKKMQEAGPCWSVSIPAQMAGVACLEDKRYEKELHQLIKEERDYLIEAFEKMQLRVVYGKANYLLFYCKDIMLGEKLRKLGIMIRECENFSGLDRHWYRIAVRTREENERLICAMKEVLQI